MIEVGQQVIFDPFAGLKFYGVHQLQKNVVGRIIMVHETHSWFLVEYGEEKTRISFKFSDIGSAVKVVK